MRWTSREASGAGSRPSFAVDNFSVNTSFSSDHFRSKATGDWNAIGTWEGSHDGTNWFNATLAPTSAANTITIRSPHIVTSTGALSIDQVTVEDGGTLATNATLTNSGNLNVNGTFQINQGGWATGGTFVYGAAGTLVFNHNNGPYDVNNDVYWPGSNSPANVTVLSGTGGIRLNNISRTVSGLFQTAAQVILNSSTLTCNGTCQLNADGSFSGTPTYGSSSTLIYNNGGSFNVNTTGEWTGNGTTAGLGIPHHVTIQNNTTVNMPTSNRGLAGNLNISSGTLALNASSGDLYIAGNWNNTDTFIPDNRAVFFNGSSDQSITSLSDEIFAYLVVNKPSGTLNLSNDVIVDGSNGSSVLQLQNGNVNTGNYTLIIGPNANYASAISRTSGHVIGKLTRSIANGNNTYEFPVGTAKGYTPAQIMLVGASGSDSQITVVSNDGTHPNFASYGLSPSKYINRWWDVSALNLSMASANVQFTFLGAADPTGDRVGGVSDVELKTAKYDGFWTYPMNSPGSNSFSATGITSFSEFMAGACGVVEVEASNNSPICTGGNIEFNTTLGQFAGSPTFSWEGPNGFNSIDQDPVITGATVLASGTYTVTMTDGIGCTDVSTTVVSVVAQPTGPTLNVKTPNTASVCTGTNVSATFNAGAGGIGCSDSYRFSTDNGGSWSAYTPGNNISTTGATTVLIQGKRDGCSEASCTGTSFVTLASWTVNALPNAGTISGTLSVCVASTTSLTTDGLSGGTWSSSNGNATVGAMTGVVTGVTAGSTVITYTVTDGNGCMSSTMATVMVNARPNAGAILGGTAVCETGTLSLGSDGLPGGTWSSSNTAAATVNSTSGLVSGVAMGSTNITYTVTDGNGCTSATSIAVTVDAQPTASNAGTDQTICSDAFAVLAANTPSVGSGAWSVTSGPSTSSSQFSSTSSPTAVFTPAGGVGTYTLTWTVTNGTCVSSDNVDINALSCLCSTSDAAATAYDDGWQTSDNDNPSAFGAWTLNNTGGVNGGRYVASSTGNNDCAAPTGDSNGDGDINTGGRAWFLYAHSSSFSEARRTFVGMPVNSSLSIRMDNGCVQNGGTVGFALQNASSATLAEVFFQGGDGAYTVNDATSGGSFSNSGVAFTDEGVEVTYVITAPGTYTIHIKSLVTGALTTLTGRSFYNPGGEQQPAQIRLFNATAGNGGGFDAAYNSLSICRPCSPFTADINGTTAVCQGSGTHLTATITDGTSPYTVVYSDGSTNFTVTGYVSGANIPVTPTGTTTYTLVSVLDAAGCFGTVGGSATVTVNSRPTVTASSNSPVCVGSDINLSATPAGGSGIYTSFAWQGPDSYTASGQNPTGFAATAAAGGTYTVTVTDNNSCTGTNTTLVVVNQPPTASVAGSGPITMCDDQCVALSANTPTVGTGAWSIMAGAPSTFTGQFTNVNAPNSKFCPSEEGEYTLVWTISNGACPPSSSTVNVTVEDCMCGTSVAHESDYDDGWQSGDTDGGVFGAWTLGTTGSNSGHFVGSSVGNNGCGTPGDSNNDGDIDLYGEAWGLYANSGETSEAVRSFSNPLGINGAFTINMDNGCVQSGGTVGLALRNASGNVLTEFYFVGGNANYTLNDAATGSSGVAFTDEGLRIKYTVTGLSTYDLQITNLATGAITNLLGRTFKNPAGGQAPAQVRLFNANAGMFVSSDLYFNELRLCAGCPVYTATLAGTTSICSGASTNLTVTMSDGASPYTVVYTDGTNNFTVTGYSSGDNIPVMPSSTTTYTLVSVEGSDGCPGVLGGSATVTVRTAPTITASNNGPVCMGNNITLTSTPAGGSGAYSMFSWMGPNSYTASVEDPTAFAATAAAGGTYTVTVTDSDGCTATNTTMVVVNPLPNAGAISGTLSVCIGATTALSSDGLSGGTWSSSNGNATVDANGVVTGVAAGSSVITYAVTDGNSCTSSTMATVTVNQFTAYALVFTESMGTTTTTTPITTHDANNAFDNDGFTMTGTGDIRSTQNSTGYSEASGGANAFLTSGGTRTFEIAGINTTAFSSLVLSFGVYKSNTLLTGSDLLVEVSSNGTTYTPLSFTALGSSADWYYRTATGTIPATANLRIRFTNVNSNYQFRIDDVQLAGLTAATPTITASGPTTFCQGGSVNLNTNSASSWLWSNSATTQSINATMTGSYSVQLTAANGCTATAGPVAVTVNSLPSAAPAPTSVCAGSTVMVNGNPSGGSGTYTTHAWTNAGGGTATGVTLSNAPTQTVTVGATGAGTINLRYQVTDNNGCSTSATVTVTVNARPSAAPASASVCTGSTVNVNGNPSGGTMPYTAHTWTDLGTGTATGYTLNNTNQQTVTVDATTATAGTAILRYQVTDNNGCTRTADVTVTINAFGVVAALFTESVGTISSNPTPIATHEAANGFDNDAFTMTGTGELRNTTVSNGYAGASGGANVFLTDSGSPNFQISGINTVGLNPVSISFGVNKSTNAENGSSLLVQVSADGTSYTTIGSPTLPTGSGTAGTDWYYITLTGSIPATSNLRIRFTNNSATNQFRIDDISVNTSSNTVTITPSGATTFCTGSSVMLASSLATSYLWSTTETTQSITVNTTGTYTVVATGNNGCTKSATQMVTVVAQPTHPTLNAKTPNTATVCEGTNVRATINTGTGGVGCSDTYEYSTNNGTSWLPYTPGSNISTTGATVVLIQAKRDGCTSGAGCTGTSFVQLASWTVQTAPVFTACPSGPIVEGTAFPACSAAVNYTVSASGSPTPVFTYAFTGSLTAGGIGTGSGAPFPQGTTNVVVAATNVCGSPTCAFTVTVNDDDAPTVNCPSNPTIAVNSNINSNTCQITVPDYVATLSATDNCSLPSSIVEAQDVPAGAYGPVSDGQVVTVTYSATDAAGNTRYCTVYITVSAPEINVQGNSINISDGDNTPDLADHTNFGGTTLGNPITRTFTIQNTGTQPLAIPLLQVTNGSYFSLGTLPATPLNAGQSTTFTVNFNASSLGVFSSTVSIYSNDCDEATYDFVVSGAVGCVAADISCPGTQTVTAAPGLCSAAVNYSVGLAGNPAPDVTYTLSGATSGTGNGTGSGLSYNVGTTTVSLSATNECGADNCSFSVVVVDNQAPTISCPAPIVRSTDPNQCSTVVGYAPTVTENCPGATTTYTFSGATVGTGNGSGSGSTFLLGTTTVALKVTDGAGAMSNCMFTITVNDTQQPNITCPANIVRNTTLNSCTAAVTFSTPAATDNCTAAPAVMQTEGPTSGSNFSQGVTLVKFKATDGANLTKECTFTVTVNDNQVPNITCPVSITTNAAPGTCAATVNYSTPLASDNCALAGGWPKLLEGIASGGSFPKGQTTIKWEAKDEAGLTRTCTFRVTVNDNEPPAISCPTVPAVNTAANTCAATVTYSTPTATDNCTGAITIVRIGGPASGSSFPVGSTAVTWRAIDVSGRSSICSFTVTVVDNQAPSISCPGNIVASGSGSSCTATVPYATPTATDNCPGTLTPHLLSGLASGSVFPAGTTVNTWRVITPNGQSSTCSFSVSVSCGSAPNGGGNNAAQAADRDQGSAAPAAAMEISPNPTTGVFNLRVAGFEHQVLATIFDATGRQVWQQRIGSEDLAGGQAQVTVDLSESRFSAGLYLVTVAGDGTVLTQRLVVQR